MKDYYYILGVDANCTENEVKVAYRKLTKKYHPDLNPNDKYFEDRFKAIQEAFDTLRDPIKRVKYDATLKRANPEPPDAEHIKRQYDWEHAKDFKHREEYLKRKAAASVKSKTRAVDIGFTVVLACVSCVFGLYVYRAMNNPTKIDLSKPPTASVAPYHPVIVKHHKRKHGLKTKTVTDSPRVSDASEIINEAPPVPAKETTVQAAPAPIATEPVHTPAPMFPRETPKPEPDKNYLYQTSVRANLTGVINMRKDDKFSSEVIKEIPSNSEVYVLEKGATYYKIAFNNNVGYVPKWTLLNK